MRFAALLLSCTAIVACGTDPGSITNAGTTALAAPIKCGVGFVRRGNKCVPVTPTPTPTPTQTCPDGTIIPTTQTCPVPPPVQCPDGTTVPAGQTCPTPTPIPLPTVWVAAPLTDVSGYARTKADCQSVYAPVIAVPAGTVFKMVVSTTPPFMGPLSGIGWTSSDRIIAPDGTVSWSASEMIEAVIPLTPDSLPFYLPVNCLEGVVAQ